MEQKTKRKIVGMTEEQVIDLCGGLVVSSDSDCCCQQCAKYAKRIYSLDGTNKQFPLLPDLLRYYNDEHIYCEVRLFPLTDLSDVCFMFEFNGNIVEWANREYIDERTEEQKENYERATHEKYPDTVDGRFYKLISEHYPDLAPKSYREFRRLKMVKPQEYKELLMKLGYEPS